MFTTYNKTKILILFILIIVFTPFFNWLYSLFFGSTCSGFYCFPNPEFSFVFFVTLFLMLFGTKNKYWYLLVLLGIVLISDFIIGAYQVIIIDFFIAFLGGFIGWALKEAIIVYQNKKIKK